MKKILIVALCFASAITTQAQSNKYVPAMQKTLQLLGATENDPAKMLQVSNDFERIAKAEKSQWLPYYYAALTQVFYGFSQQPVGGLDAIADKANALLQVADSMQKDNSEISCVKSMIATLRMLVNPQQRYMQMAQTIEGNLQAAMKQDPNNPRPYFLKAQNLKNTPEAFGGGCHAAKEFLDTAQKKYETFKPENELAPNWGKPQLEAIIEDCK